MQPALDDTFNHWSLTALTPFPGWLLGLVGVALAAALLLVARPLRSARPRLQYLLLMLRGTGLVAAWTLLWEPALLLQQVSSTPARVAVMLDTSRSMALPTGEADGKTRLARALAILETARGAWAKLPNHVTVEAWTLGKTAAPAALDALGQVTALGDQTNLAGALQTVLNEQHGKPLAGVLLLSDGADNVELPGETLTPQLSDLLKRAGVPVHTVCVGAERGFKDVEISSVHADDFAFVRNPLEVEATVDTHGFEALTLPVTLKKDGKVLQVVMAQEIPPEGRAKVVFKFEPREVGEAVYSVDVPAQVGEALTDNNRRFFTVKVIRDRIRVLQVAGRPSWDVRFLRKLLKENPSVDLISFFILRTPTDSTTARPDELSLIPFPTRELFTEELGTFDVVIFQNFNFAPYEMGGYLPNVKQFVLGGGGFAMVGGDLSFSEGGYENTVLSDLLPVVLPPGRGHYVQESYTPVVTQAGTRHPILGFPGLDPQALITQLPALDGFNATLGLAPGAEALLTHPAPRQGPPGQPVLSVREVGKGRTLALNTDSLWFWALPDALGGGRGTRHRELWANAIRWLIGDPALSRVRVEARAGAFDPGEDVALTVRAFDPSYRPLPGASVLLTLERVDAPLPPIQEEGVTGPDGQWLITLKNPGPGAYRARATARWGSATLGVDEDAFLVRETDRETAEGVPRPALLAALSDASGGSVVKEGGDVMDLTWKLPQGVLVHKRKTQPLWDQAHVVALILALWTLEWILRRRAGFA